MSEDIFFLALSFYNCITMLDYYQNSWYDAWRNLFLFCLIISVGGVFYFSFDILYLLNSAY